MANIAALLKQEITRLARKELRGQMEGMKKASAQSRRDIAALKRQTVKLERQVSLLEGKVLTKAPVVPVGDTNGRARFTAKGLRSQRKRLKLSATDYSKLVGVTPISIYNWEKGSTRPRKTQLGILAALRGMGKKEAQARLRQLTGQKPAARQGSVAKPKPSAKVTTSAKSKVSAKPKAVVKKKLGTKTKAKTTSQKPT